ncbi:MAG TPA: N,N-dimethylformamidase beta subunit family domain-containing protein, partial [Ktedonobacteraceae bacterium]
MNHRVERVIKSRVAIMVAIGFIASIVLSGLPYASMRNILVSPSHAHAAGLNPIQVENSKAGTPSWDDFASDLAPDTISGFGSKISVNHGDSLDLYVTTIAPSFTIDVFRTGYYGGAGARLITSLGSFPGLHQAIPAPDPVTGTISCTGWTKTTTLTIPATWVTGVYLAKLTSSTNHSSFIYFVVRDDGGSEDVMFQTSVTTYQAYNTWGGTSLYNNVLTNKTVYPYPHATKVSFDRPFNPGDSNGAGHYLFFEYHFVYWMEQQGYNVAYTTDIDTDAHPAELLKHKAFLSVGHDEYWTMGMHNAVQSAISAGVNVAFFSANTMYWQIRLEPNTAGVADRIEVGYKDFATSSSAPGPDPMWNVNNSLVTTNWRDPVVNMPENGLLGVMYEQQEDIDYAYTVTNASNWIYAGTGFVDGTKIPGIVGYEYDRVWNNGFSPANETVLSNSPVNGGGGSSFANSTLYTASSGARVFAAGTIQWSWGLANVLGNTYANAGIQKTTANILNNFISSPSAPTSGVTLSADSLNFGNQGVNKPGAVQTVKVTNSSTAALTISKIAVTGTNVGDFAQTNTCPSSLAVNASCTISATFQPTASGGRSANITLTDSSTVSPQVIAMSGLGIASGAAVNLSVSNLNFGNQTVKTS